MPKLKSSDATKKLYWKRKNAKLSNHDKRVEEWKRKGKIFLNCGSKPMHKDDIMAMR